MGSKEQVIGDILVFKAEMDAINLVINGYSVLIISDLVLILS